MKINTYFTQNSDVRSIILDHLSQAKKHVVVAVAWFTDTVLFEKLIEIASNGVKVEIIITDHEFNTQSKNDYLRIELYDGFFAAIGNDEQLMHMKFCVIDLNVVISGSANWSNRAFTVNSEEVTIVEGDPGRSTTFMAEFDRLKQLSGFVPTKRELDLAKAIKYFKLIKAFINLGDPLSMLPYANELKEFKELESIGHSLINGQYERAISEMNDFEKRFSQLLNLSEYEKAQLKMQINLLSMQIQSIEVQKVEMEAILEQFNHRYIIELSPLITKILKLKAKIFSKLKKHGVEDNTYAKAKEDFENAQKEYQEEVKVDIPDLNDEEQKDIKKMYREASRMCYPESHYCIFDDKIKAAEIFSDLTKAYKSNDINSVTRIWNELKLGITPEGSNTEYEIEQLRAKLEALKLKYEILVNEVKKIIMSENYQSIMKIEDWNEYFESQKIHLEKEFEKLKGKYVNHE
jgi:hypothetical protein